MSEETKCEEKKCCCKIWKAILLLAFAYTFLTTTYMAVKLGVFNPSSPLHQVSGGKPSGDAQGGQDFLISEKYDKGQSFEKAQKTGKPVVAWFYVDWCGYCKHFAPVFDKVTKQKDFKKNFAVAFVNCEKPENQELVAKYKIEGYPTVYVVKPDGSSVHVDNQKLFEPDAEKQLVKDFLEAAGKDVAALKEKVMEAAGKQ